MSGAVDLIQISSAHLAAVAEIPPFGRNDMAWFLSKLNRVMLSGAESKHLVYAVRKVSLNSGGDSSR